MERTAIVVGATGLVGGHLVQQLLTNPRYAKVKVVVRRPWDGVVSEKLEVIRSSLTLESLAALSQEPGFRGDDFFCALGTTIKKAGSQEAFREVDYDLALGLASIARSRGIPNCLLVSSIGASATAPNFYLGIKGKLEEAMSKLGFQRILIFRPSFLLGQRKEKRILEHLGISLTRLIRPAMVGPLVQYRPIEAQELARQMIEAALDPSMASGLVPVRAPRYTLRQDQLS